MPLHKSETKTIYQGREMYAPVGINKETGELQIIGDTFEADQVVRKVERQGFEITYLAYFIDLFDKLGGQKYKVFKYIIEHKNADNQLIITNRELAKKCGVGINTVTETLKLLREAGLVNTRTGSIMLLPKLAHRGSSKKELYLMQKFEAFDCEDV